MGTPHNKRRSTVGRRAVVRSKTVLKIHEVVRYQVLGKDTSEIAALMGMTRQSVSELVKLKDYEKIRDEYVGKMYRTVDEVIESRSAGGILEAAAPSAAEELVELMTDPDPVQRRISSMAVLDRTGHGPIHRKAIRKRVELDPVLATLLSEAMRSADPGRVLEAEVLESSTDE